MRPCAVERVGALPSGVGAWGCDMRPTMGRRVPGWAKPVCKEFCGEFSSPTASVPLPLPVPPLEDSAVPWTGAVSDRPLYTPPHTHAHAHAHTAGKQDLSAGFSAALSTPPGIGQRNGQTGSPGPDHAGLSCLGFQFGRLLLEAWEAGIRPLLVCPGSRLACTLRSSWLTRGS